MLGALAKKLFGGGKESKAMAKSRLHFVLVQDRTGLTNDQMAKFRGELVEVIQRYFVIDEQGFDIAYERQDESTTLVINSPVVVKRQEGAKGRVGSAAAGNSAAANGSKGPARTGTDQEVGKKIASRSGSRRARRSKRKQASANA